MKITLIALAVAAFLAAAPVWPQGTGAAPAAAPQTVDSVRQALRTDKRGLVERNMQLDAAQAAKFWPLYDEYQRELERITKRQNRALLDYVNAESTMTDANAKRIAHEILAADADEQKLRERYLRKMQKVLPARKAVRYMQIENKLRTLQRYDIAERMSLVQ